MRNGIGRRLGSWAALPLVIVGWASASLAAPPPPAVPGHARLAEAKADPAARGQLLLGELNCLSCHAAPQNDRVQARPAPDLSAVGSRATPQWLKGYLTDPQAMKPGTPMPHVFHASDLPTRQKAVEELTHYLVSLGGPVKPATVEGTKLLVEAGDRLFHSIGCVACHAPMDKAGKPLPTAVPSIPLGNLAAKTTADQLAAFLLDPHAARPSGRMPSLKLTTDEARMIAVYLLREQLDNPQTKDGPPAEVAGVRFSYWEVAVKDCKAETIDKIKDKPKLTGTLPTISANIPKAKSGNWVARFSGTLKVPADGQYTFYTTSDDGSRVYVDGKQVLENDGIHPPTEKSGAITLKAGPHPMAVTFFQGGGGAELKVEWAGPGIKRQAIPADAITNSEGRSMVPLGTEPFVVDKVKAKAGQEIFTTVGCASCHALPNQKSLTPTKPLASLNADAADGCLSENVANGRPNFFLSAAQRDDLKAAVKGAADLAKPIPPKEQAIHSMAALNCLACHKRGDVGGVSADRDPYFAMAAEFDMGDEGRLPPQLTDVGEKLKPEAIERIVTKGELHIRQVLATRMPLFHQAAAAPAVAALSVSEDTKRRSAPSAFTEAAAKDGRVLFGNAAGKSLGCVNCHGVLGQKSLGMPAPDLTLTAERLNRHWYSGLMHDPNAVNPGTRMPGFWVGGVVPIKGLGGDTAQGQIDALYHYLSLGKSMALPAGLEPTGKSELVATDEPVLHRTFFAGVGPRTVLVGYPEQLNVAFDANLVRLAVVWRGRFFDPAGMWDGRGGKANGPLGTDVVNLPAVATFAVLPSADAAWPKPDAENAEGKIARNAGGKFLGYELDADRRPTFRYRLGEVEIREQPIPKAKPGGSTLVRRFEVAGKRDNLYLLAAVGKSIVAQKDGSYLIDGKVTVTVMPTPAPGSAVAFQPVVRDGVGGNKELVVPVNANNHAGIDVEMSW